MSMSPYYQHLRERIGTELLLIPAVAAVIRNQENQILIQRSHHNTWSLPAGAIEPGESPAQAVLREVYEETGLRVQVNRTLAILGGSQYRWSYPNGDCVEGLIVVFECQYVSDSGLKNNDETAFVQWFHIDELPELAVAYPVDVLRGSYPTTYFE